MVQHLFKCCLLQKSADMRLALAGCSGLRVGPPRIAPKIVTNVLEIWLGFEARVVTKKVTKVTQMGSQMDPTMAPKSGN